MKRIYLTVVIKLFLFIAYAFSQTSPPEKISYQGIARDASGAIISGQPIRINLIIRQGSTGGPVVFSEQHSVTTNTLGLFTLEIGSISSSSFQAIPWNNGPYYLEVLMDPTGGTNYVPIGTPQQILSVPYALYSKSSYSSAVSAISYSTVNTPTIGITTNTSTTNATLTITQGTNTASTVINFPPPPPANINIISSGIANVTPSSGTNFTVDVPPPNLNIVSGSSDATITITQGTVTTTQTLTFPPASVPNVSINATGIVTVAPNSGTAFTIGAPTPTINAGTGIGVSGTYPNFTISNTAPNQTVNINAGTNVTVTGTYPNFNISSTPTLSINSGSISISGGNTVPLPASNVTINAAGVATINTTTGNNFNIGVPNPTLNITSGVNNATISVLQGTATSTQTLVFPSNSHTITGTGIATVTPTSGNNFTVNVPTPTLNIINGTNNATISVLQGTATSTQTLVFPSNSHTITGTGIATVTPTSGNNFTVNVPSSILSLNTNTLTLTQGTATSTVNLSSLTPTNSWQLTGNVGTTPSTHFLGTTDAKDLVFRTNNIERMRIAGNGNIGIGTTSPLYPLHTVYSGTNSNVHYIDYTSASTSGANSAIFAQATSTAGGNIFGGYFQVTGSNLSNVAAAVKAFNTANASGFNYGIEATSTGTTNTGTNIGGYFSASGGANNYAAIFDQGNVGIGNTSPGFKLDITNNTSNLGGLRINNNSGMALYIDNNSSGAGIYVSHNSSNNAITIQNFNSFGNNIWSVANSTNAINIDIEKGYLRYQPQGISATYPKGGVMMNSNTNGDMIIANSPTPTIISGANVLNNTAVTVTTTPTLPSTLSGTQLGTGTLSVYKQYDNSVVEINLMCEISGVVPAGGPSCDNLLVWIGIDSNTSESSPVHQSSVYREALLPAPGNPFAYNVVVKCYFYGTQGFHTIKVYALAKSSPASFLNNVYLDAGYYYGKIFIKEHF